jgi:ribose transport system substrate-binding protein
MQLKLKHLSLASAAVTAALAIGACGGAGDSGGAAQGGSATDTAGVTQAVANVKKWSAAPTTVGLDAALPKTPPRGKTIVQLRCFVEGCQAIYQGLDQATKALGWTAKAINMGPTPEEVGQAFDSALAMHPAGILVSGVSSAVYKQQLEKARKQGIPVVTLSSADAATGMNGNGIISSINGPDQAQVYGKVVASWVAADSKGKANVAFFTIKNFPTLDPVTNSFTAELKRLCPDCTVDKVEVQASDLGKGIPQQVVSAIQQQPDTKYVGFAFGQMSTGVRPALNGAGFKDVKIVGVAPYAANLQALRDGTEQMWAGHTNVLQGWYAADAFARYFEGANLKPSDTLTMPTQVLTHANVPSEKWYVVPGYEQKFDSLWKLG